MALTTKYDKVCSLIQDARNELLAKSDDKADPADIEREEAVLTHIERAQAAALKMQRRERANARNPILTA